MTTLNQTPNAFSGIEVEDDATEATPTATPTVTRGVTVDAEGAARGTRDYNAAVAAGFSPKPPIYTLGTMVIEEGVRRFRQSRREFESLPSAVEACENLIEKIGKESREDKKASLPHLTMLHDGRVHNSEDGQAYLLSERGFTGLCGFATPGGAGYLAQCPPGLRADNLNHWLPESYRVDARATKKAEDGQVVEKAQEVTLRTRNTKVDGEPLAVREAFAVVGPRYGEHDADKIAAQIIEAVPGNAKCQVVYDGFRARFDILWHSDIQPTKVVAGEIYKAGVRVSTADDGTNAIKVSAVVERNLCLNLIIIDRAKQDIVSRRHVGKDIASDIAKGIQTAMLKMAHFSESWDAATLESVVARYGIAQSDAGMEKLFKGIAYNKLVYIPGVGYKAMAEKLYQAWQKEPGYTRASVVNAVTRAAHQSEWRDWSVEEQVALQGSNLLFTKRDWNVAYTEQDETSTDVQVALL